MDRRDLIIKMGQLHALRKYHILRMLSDTDPDIKIYPGQPPILEYLDSHENCTQAELAEFLHVSPPSIAVSIRRMQKSGLVARRIDECDMRCNRLFPTEKGKRFLSLWREQRRAVDEKLFSGFSDEETELLFSFLTRLTDNLSSDVSDDDVICFLEKHTERGDEKE